MLEHELTKLATAIRAEVTKHKQTNSVPVRRHLRVRRRDFSLKYRDNFGFANFQPNRIEQDVWDWSDEEQFQNSIVKKLPEYESVASALESRTNFIDGFARTICFGSFQGLSDAELIERVSALGRELEGQPIPVSVIAFIDGISVSNSPLTISDRFILRHPTEEDVAEYIFLDEYGGSHLPLGETWFNTVGDFVFDAVSTGHAQAEFLRIMEALRLFRVGGVACNRYRMQSKHLHFQGRVAFIGGGSTGRHSPFAYTLTNFDTAELKKFVDGVAPLLPDSLQPDKAMSEKEIAYTRYRDALFIGGPSERAITSAMTALEALFLEGEPELTHRLAQRVSVFLRVLGTQLDAKDTYNTVKKGYRIRSTFIHGDALKDRAASDSLAPILLEFARECVLAFFQIATPKRDLLQQLDEAMIDPLHAGALNTSLGAVVHK